MTPSERKEAVEYAARELEEILSSEAILNALTPEERRCDEYCEALWKLREKSATAQRFAMLSGLDLTQLRPIVEKPAIQASDDAEEAGGQDNYLTHLTRLLAASDSDPISFDALFRHAAELYRRGEWPVPQLRKFKDEVDSEERARPRNSKPRNVEERDDFIAMVIHEVHCIFNVPLTRNDASDHCDSACDIVAEAMTVIRKSPSSIDSMRKIWSKRALAV
ncbi:hypothetical protein E4L95_17425 [Paracoccus liaowanqingii]|uniref:Uncharacterized protein n=1 Tax=Paracoccus liaowanqingii TaxID=2560053 RepID=A0A4P7HLK3_9RHOB|nr:hypothetical protein [Paracoccus liaowanqingii]QBX35109.1 hypothetical protein E4191_10640 [Paracoccus liaowanqingii]TGN50463.1 hypothetical protein E4L95_17425 [Paracoccus liaowanqingii]